MYIAKPGVNPSWQWRHGDWILAHRRDDLTSSNSWILKMNRFAIRYLVCWIIVCRDAWVRILASLEEVNVSPFDLKSLPCVHAYCKSNNNIIKNETHVCLCVYMGNNVYNLVPDSPVVCLLVNGFLWPLGSNSGLIRATMGIIAIIYISPVPIHNLNQIKDTWISPFI